MYCLHSLNSLRRASERTQLIVTTHSDVLVDALTDMPEAVLVAGRSETGTTLERLNQEKLKPLVGANTDWDSFGHAVRSEGRGE